MPESMFDWFPLPAIRKATDAPRRVLADVLGFPATPIYATSDDEPTDACEPRTLALPAPTPTAAKATTPATRTQKPRSKKRRRKTRRRSR